MVHMVFMRLLMIVFLGLVAGAAVPLQAEAQSYGVGTAGVVPPLPAPLATLEAEGAQIRYLGRHDKYHGWAAFQQGSQQYFYQETGSDLLFMGLLFDEQGRLITVDQLRALQSREGQVIDELAGGLIDQVEKAESLLDQQKERDRAFKTPSEQLFSDVSASNWIPLGQPGAPVIYSFIDPQCPHCHAMINDLRQGYLGNGLVQLRIIPVGFRPESLAQAAFLLAGTDPVDRLYAHIDEEESLPADPSVNTQGVERNMAIMQSWDLTATPFSIYRAADGSVRLVEGRPDNWQAILGELPPAR